MSTLDLKNPGFSFGVKYQQMKIICKTLFDCTYTGITGNFKASQVPFVDRAGNKIENLLSWNHSRNQQRNWETILQIISLNAQPQNVSIPTIIGSAWEFEFFVESDSVFGLSNDADPLAGLKQNCNNVPMITGLREQTKLEPVLVTSGDKQNIWFQTINMILE